MVSQLLCTSLWFAGNAAVLDLIDSFNLPTDSLSSFITAVQLGFIAGTLIFAVGAVADRYSPSKVFFVCAILGSLSNAVVIWFNESLDLILAFRFLTGFFLAGIYPVGMKIAADHFDKDLGRSLGWLVGALVLGTALPHLISYLSMDLSWRYVFIGTSLFASIGGIMILTTVPDGSYHQPAKGLKLSSFTKSFSKKSFRASAMGYFGHMWELYAFWTFVPLLISKLDFSKVGYELDSSLWSFIIIGIGGLACVISGRVSTNYGSATVARWSVLISGLCCIVVPLTIYFEQNLLALITLIIWGMNVVADSPLFSTLVAQNCDRNLKGTSLTVVNCIGFSITIISIQVLDYFWMETSNILVFSLLALGPLVALLSMRYFKKRTIN